MRFSRRAFILLIVFFVLSATLAAGSRVTLSPQDAQSLAGQIRNVKISTLSIFENNVQIALIEFIPLAGPAFGVYSSYVTGLTLSALAQTSPQSHLTGIEAFFLLLITPIYWLEFFSYSLAVEESVAIVISIRNRDLFSDEWKWVLGSIAGVFIVLLVSARLEVTLIQFLGTGATG